MPMIGISITKSTPFRNSNQEFSNVYYYDITGSLPTQPQAAALIDELVALEKTFHSTAVTFVRGRLWSAGGSAGTNEMIDQHNLSGTGTTTLVTNMDKERAFLFRVRAGNDSRGNPVYLRKWYHSCGRFDTAVAVSTQALENSSGFTQAERDTMANKMNTVRDIGGAGPWTLIAKSGRKPPDENPFQCHQFLEHHQMGDMWRAQ
jgi:hypothetical protein